MQTQLFFLQMARVTQTKTEIFKKNKQIKNSQKWSVFGLSERKIKCSSLPAVLHRSSFPASFQ